MGEFIDFGDLPNESAMKHYGFANTDHLSDDECKDLFYDLEHILSYEQSKKKEGQPLSEYGQMIEGMAIYIGNQLFTKGGCRYKEV
jgi:hypothetical protein